MTNPKPASSKGTAGKGSSKKGADKNNAGPGKLAGARKKFKKKDSPDEMQDLKFGKSNIRRELDIDDIEEKAKQLTVKQDENSPVTTTGPGAQTEGDNPGTDTAGGIPPGTDTVQPGAQTESGDLGTDTAGGVPQPSPDDADVPPAKKRKEVKGDSKGRVRLSAALEATVEYPAWEDFVDSMGIDGMKLIRNILVEKMVQMGRIDPKLLKTPLLKI